MAMGARSQTPVQDTYSSIPHPNDPTLINKGYGPRSSSRPNSWVAGSSSYPTHGTLADPSPIPHNARFREELDPTSQRASLDGSAVGMQRSASLMSHGSRSATPSRSSTLRKKSSLSKRGSVRRSGSRRSMRAGSVRSLNLGDKEKYAVDGDDPNSAFYVPIPTNGTPTETLANRFQAWRKFVKELIVFFKELQKSYEARSKLLSSASGVMHNTSAPQAFLQSGGLSDATEIIRDFHRQAYLEANKAAEVESEVIKQLTSLRNDLQKKTKEIKNLSGDFKNSVDKEMEGTRKTVRHLHEALGLVDTDPSATSGKGDPFIVRLNVDKQIEKQIEEENYLHRAFLNLESSGRELESIVVSEIQKAYNAYASILKREADGTYDTVEKLRVGPISMPRDHEWNAFIANTDELVDPRVSLRNVENITYPGKDHPAAAEVRSGMLERKSKYLKSYTPGWYVLSPTHLHEFKSADRLPFQTPVMSLYLPDQKLGSHSQPDSTSFKFMLKGRQTGAMHRGHSWVFRAESYETMMAWYEDIASLISKTGEARNAYVRRHVRSVSGTSVVSSDGAMDEDEADRIPYSSEAAVLSQERPTSEPRQPGGRFPSDVQIDQHQNMALSPSSEESSGDKDLLVVAGSPPGGHSLSHARSVSDRGKDPSPSRMGNEPVNSAYGQQPPLERHDSYYGDWMGPSAAAAPQQKLAQQQKLSEQADDDKQVVQTDRENVTNTIVAVPGSTGSHEQRNRRGSGSSVPTTTNVTENTNNTIPTSFEDNQGQLADRTKDESEGTSDTITPATPTGETPNGVEIIGDDSSLGRQGKDSMSTLELKIPGRYPPPNVPAG